MNGTSWLLGAGYPWYSGTAGAEEPGSLRSAVVANSAIGLSLATLPAGPLGLASPDDSLGRLTLPRGVAVENDDVYILSEDGALVYRYDPVLATLVPLAHVGAQGLSADADASAYLEPRRFRGAKNIAVVRGELYVADPVAHRVQVFDLRTLALLRIHAHLIDPVDVASSRRAAYILDRGAGRVYRAEPGTDRLSVVVDPIDRDCRSRHWDRLAIDEQERIYLRYRDCETTELDVFTTGGCSCVSHQCERVYDSAQVRDRFAPPVVTSNAAGGFDLPEYLFDPPQPSCRPSAKRGRIRLTRSGVVLRPDKGPPSWPADSHERAGTWTSQWLNSDLYNCVWHVIELSVARMPAGSSILVRTRTSNDAQTLDEVRASSGAVNAGSWRDTRALVAAAQPDPKAPETLSYDVLVPSPPGQYLQLQIVLQGNGTSTPLIRHARLRFPRESLLQYLPAIYSSPPEQQEFLDRFLSIAQTTWTAIEQEVDTFERYLDPDSVPDGALAYLAGWLDVRLEGTWTPAQNRRLLKAMPGLRTRWGTLAGMRDWLRVYLSNLAGLSQSDLERLGVPGIVESFVDRRRLRLADGGATLCEAHALWSPAVERRFQVGVYDRLGEVELVSTGDPELDVFHHYAHSFRVYVPASLVRTPEHEALLRRAIELQKPAHAAYELLLVEPRIRIGDQSTLELDTIIGAPIPGRLSCAADIAAPSAPPHQRLGFDTTLGCGSAPDDYQLERSLA